jgi:hypothetical protein
MTDVTPTHLTIDQLAERWHMSPRTLEKWRTLKKGPRYLKFGRKKVLYPIAAVVAFEKEGLECHAAA